jgi:flagellar basal body rod protein FlgG
MAGRQHSYLATHNALEFANVSTGYAMVEIIRDRAMVEIFQQQVENDLT